MTHHTRAKIYTVGLLLSLLSASFIPLSHPLAAKARVPEHESRKGERAPAAPDTQTPEQPVDVVLAAPFWSTADGFVSTIEMKNYHVSNPLTVTPVLHLEYGGDVALDPIQLKPSETRRININQALAKRGLYAKVGAAEIRHAPEGAFGANLTVLNEPKSLIYNFQFRTPDMTTKLEGLWWFYDGQTDGFVAAQNAGDADVTVTPTLYARERPYRLDPVKLRPHEMTILRLREQLHKLGLENETSGGISLESSLTGVLVAGGGLVNPGIGFSAPLRMDDPETLSMNVKRLGQTLHAIGVSIGSDLTTMSMGLPEGTLMNPIMNLRNISGALITVRPVFKYDIDGAPQSFALPEVRLNPQQVKRVDLLPYWQSGQIFEQASWGSLEINYTGKQGALIASVTSVDQTGTYVFDARIDNRLAAGFHGEYWSIEGDNDTAVTVKNISDKPATCQLSLQYDEGRGNFRMQPLTLRPGEARMIMLRELQHEHVTGVDGKPLPVEATFGGLKLTDARGGRHFLIDAVVFNPKTATCGVCGYGCLYPLSIHAIPSNLSLTVGGAGGSTVIEASMCDGSKDDTYGCDAEYTDDNPSVVDVTTGCPTWDMTGLQAGIDHMTIAAIDVPGPHCGEQNLFTAFSAVVKLNIGKIQYQSGSSFVDISGTLYVLKGTSVTFKAIPDPDSATFPTGQPTWSGSSGASGTGETTTVTFNTTSSSTSDFKTVVSTAGNTVTVNVVVFDLFQLRTANDNFAGRSDTSFGVAEIVGLTFTSSPSITSTQAGGLTWKVTSGNINVVNSTNGQSSFTAPDSPETDTLKLEIQSGPSQGLGPSVGVSIVGPDGYNAVQVGGVRHTQGKCDIEFQLTPYLTPKDVSFSRIGFLEDTAVATATGYYAALGLSGARHDANGPYSIDSCNINSGCKVEDIDQVGDPPDVSRPTPCTDGDFTWNIPWQYLVRPGLSPANFSTVTHHQFTNNPDTVSIEKAGLGPFSKKSSDPNSSL